MEQKLKIITNVSAVSLLALSAVGQDSLTQPIGDTNSIHQSLIQARGASWNGAAKASDVIGMTAAHEADLCGEIGLRYNSLAIIDNYANGLEGTEIDFTKFKDLVKIMVDHDLDLAKREAQIANLPQP